MKETSRRELGRALLGLGVLGGSGGMSALASAAETALAMPDRPMRLSRRLERGLGGDASIIVYRDWRITFDRQGRGMSIRGAQIASRVEAPTTLRALADIEERRSTAEMWPILLAQDGRIEAGGNAISEAAMRAAMEEARLMVAARDISAGEREAHLEALQRIQTAGAALLNQMPDDLFYPMGAPLNSEQSVDLQDGLMGSFELTYDAQCADAGPWLGRASRTVTTRIGSSVRQSREDWAMGVI